jgi:hypothetical protein
MRPGTPVFTKFLAPGLGLAEDPGQGDSFGQHRCRLLADAMILAYEQGKKAAMRECKRSLIVSRRKGSVSTSHS